MSTILTPLWTDNLVVQAPYALGYGASLVSTTNLDLRAKHGGMLFIGVGRSGTTTLTYGISVFVRRLLNNGTATAKYSASHFSAVSGLLCGQRLINSVPGYIATTKSFAFDGTGGTLFSVGDIICFWGVTAIPGADGLVSPANGSEFLRCGTGTTTPLKTDDGCGFAKIDNEIFCQGDAWMVWLPGGSLYEVVWDYLQSTAGGRVLCAARLQTYDSDQIA
jgi:hypothetical protein